MTFVLYMTSSPRPCWDGSRILFEISNGDELVPCAISRAALEGISETRCPSVADLMRCFAGARGNIERLAMKKLKARMPGMSGRLSLWADDLDSLPPGGASVAACRGIACQGP